MLTYSYRFCNVFITSNAVFRNFTNLFNPQNIKDPSPASSPGQNTVENNITVSAQEGAKTSKSSTESMISSEFQQPDNEIEDNVSIYNRNMRAAVDIYSQFKKEETITKQNPPFSSLSAKEQQEELEKLKEAGGKTHAETVRLLEELKALGVFK